MEVMDYICDQLDELRNSDFAKLRDRLNVCKVQENLLKRWGMLELHQMSIADDCQVFVLVYFT